MPFRNLKFGPNYDLEGATLETNKKFGQASQRPHLFHWSSIYEQLQLAILYEVPLCQNIKLPQKNT